MASPECNTWIPEVPFVRDATATIQLGFRGQEQVSSEASSNITGTARPMATNACQKEAKNAGDRVDYNQDTHSVTSQEPQLGNNLAAVR